MNENTKVYANEDIDRLLKRFKLLDIREHYEDQIQLAIEKDLGYREFLMNLLIIEAIGKKERLVEKNIKAARFENIKTLDSFDFNFSKGINKQKIYDFESLSFLENKENIILIGPPGVGKSHISSAIGVNGCYLEKKVLYVTALELIYELGYFKMNKEKESIFFNLSDKDTKKTLSL